MSGPMWMPAQPPTLARVLAWHPQPIPLLPSIAVVLLVGYVAGVVLLHRRGVRWPLSRLLMWILGLVIVLVATGTGIEGYGMELFSIHMIQHMILNMLAPIFLALGAPMTLLLRVLPAGERGRARRVLLAVLHSRVSSFITHPVIIFLIFIMSLYGLYFTPVFDTLMRTWWGHNLMLIHFLIVGYVYFWSILGVDPTPRQRARTGSGWRSMPGHVLSVLELTATTPFHAFFGIVVMMSTNLMVNFYATPVPGWNISPLSDQGMGGGIAWSFTEVPTLIVLGVLVSRWQSADRRITARRERRTADTGDLDMDSYNVYLDSLAHRDMRHP